MADGKILRSLGVPKSIFGKPGGVRACQSPSKPGGRDASPSPAFLMATPLLNSTLRSRFLTAFGGRLPHFYKVKLAADGLKTIGTLCTILP